MVLELIRTEPDPELIDYCERLLGMARSGDLIGLGIVAVERDGTSTAYSGGPWAQLVAGAAELQQRLLR